MQGLQSPSQDTHYVVLQTFKKLFKKYRYSFPTKELVDEMMFVIPTVGPVILTMLKNYYAYLVESLKSKNQEGEALALDLIGFILHIVYSLTSVEFPAFFDDTLAQWMEYFANILNMPGNSESLLKCKTRVIKDVTLLCEKYASDVEHYIPGLFDLIWNQIDLTTMDGAFDKVNLPDEPAE